MPLTDTESATLARMDALYRQMTPTEKLRRVRELTLMANHLALEGLRSRYPNEPEEDIVLRLARVRLGADLFERVHAVAQESDDE